MNLIFSKRSILIVVFALQLVACAQAPMAVVPARQIETQRITLGNLQSSVKKGATSSEVVAALSSPTIVTSNRDGTETWVYDKIITESESATGFRSSVSVSSTRTFIVVVKFGLDGLVETVQYRQTSY